MYSTLPTRRHLGSIAESLCLGHALGRLAIQIYLGQLIVRRTCFAFNEPTEYPVSGLLHTLTTNAGKLGASMA